MDAEREQEIRRLAVSFSKPNSGHGRMATVLNDLLEELDDVRADASEWQDRYEELLADTTETPRSARE
jgi:hypothetical protein